MQGNVGLELLFFERIRGLPAPYRSQYKFAPKRWSNPTLIKKKGKRKEGADSGNRS